MLKMIQSVKFKQVNKPTCRLINPTKSEIGKISKNILDRINSTIAKKHNLNQWKNTTAVINWFKSIENKQQFSFICVDIEVFYPSISQDLLNKALDVASIYDNITTEERNIIIHAKNSILIHKHIQRIEYMFCRTNFAVQSELWNPNLNLCKESLSLSKQCK